MNAKKSTKPRTPKPPQEKPELCGKKAIRKGIPVTCWNEINHEGKHEDPRWDISWRRSSYEV